jgi:3-phytase
MAGAFALVNGKNGVIHQYALNPGGEGFCELELVNHWKLDSQPEGMVADDEFGVLYIGEEDRGIWRLSLTDPASVPALIPESQKENNPAIEYDVEGLALYYGGYASGFLVASSQGNFSYAVFDRLENRYIGSFIIAASNGIDGVEETDGLDILSKPLGTRFPDGILVVQDGFNFSDSVQIGQNFKYVQMTDLLRLLKKQE